MQAPHAIPWPTFLRRTALAGVEGLPDASSLRADPAAAESFLANFRDERGHRRRVDRPFLAAHFGLDPGPPPIVASPDEALWWALHRQDPAPLAIQPQTEGPLIPQGEQISLEVWTESELCGLHALWALAARRADPGMQARVIGAARWHVAHTQPDNATNHPWAVHVFLMLAAHGSPDARLYAETLVHNCQVSLGRPDRFSAIILLDAARALEAATPAAAR